MKRKLVWRMERAFEGWGCSKCGWVYPNPSFEAKDKEHLQLVREKFEKHECVKNPRKAKKAASS